MPFKKGGGASFFIFYNTNAISKKTADSNQGESLPFFQCILIISIICYYWFNSLILL